MIERNNWKFLAVLSIISTFTGSGIVFFSFLGIAVTPIRVIGILALLGMIIQRGSKSFVISKYEGYFLLIFTYMLFDSVILSPNLINSLKLLLDYTSCMAIFILITTTCHTRRNYTQYLIAYMGAMGVTILICIYEYFTGNHITSNYAQGGYDTLTLSYLQKAPTAFLFNPNNVGVLAIVSIPIMLLLRTCIKKNEENGLRIKGKRIILTLNTITVTLIPVVVLMTGSRGALVSCSIIFVIYLLGSRMKLWKKILIILLVTIAIYYGLDFIYKQLGYGGMLVNGQISIFNEGDGGRQDIIELIKENVFSNQFLFGTGVGGTSMKVGMSAHNFIYELLGDFGIVGFGLFLVGIGAIFKKIWSENDKDVKFDMLTVILSVILSMFIPPTFLTLHFVWVVLAFVYCYPSCSS